MSLNDPIFKAQRFDTPLGIMRAIADENALYILEFLNEGDDVATAHRMFQKNKKHIIVKEKNHITRYVEKELKAYFSGALKNFQTPLHTEGTLFQKKAWNSLLNIPYGQTRSYAEQAQALGKAQAFRAVGNANSMNTLAIIIPCHRIITSSGQLGGYAGGLWRKKWLLQHEKQNA